MEPKIVTQKVDVDPMLAVFASKAYTELFTSFGPTAADITYHYGYYAVVAYWANEIVGFIMFSHEDKGTAMYVRLGYVRPEYRRQGIYAKLWAALIAEARSREAVRIWGGTHVKNAPMRAFWAKMGRPENFVSGEFLIPKE